MKTNRARTHSGSIIRLLLVLVMIGVVFIVSLGAVVYSSILPDSEFRVLQKAVLQELPESPGARVAVRAPTLLLSLAQVALRFVDDVDPEARLALRALRGGQVGIYPLRDHVSQGDKVRILNSADAAMEKQHWNRVVAVLDHDVMVLAYTPATADDPGDLRVLTMVLNENELILAGVDGDLHPLYDLARPHIEQAKARIGRERD